MNTNRIFSRMCLAKIQGFYNTVDHALDNTRQIVKNCLEIKSENKNKEFTDEWWEKREEIGIHVFGFVNSVSHYKIMIAAFLATKSFSLVERNNKQFQ